MAGVDTSFRKNAATEFLVKQELSELDIHARIQSVFGDACVGVINDRR
jgi:hypothetical protein